MMSVINFKPKIVFLTTGYPTNYRPHECIFVHRSIKALSESIQPEVIHFRALKPGRPVIEKRVWDGIDVTSVACPQLPLGSYSHINTQLLEYFGKAFVDRVLSSADLIHAAEAYPAGYVAGKWALKKQKPFTFNVIGSDLYLFLTKNYSKLGNRWLKSLKGVVCNSGALKEDLKQLMGELPNVRTVYRGVDTANFSPIGDKVGPQESLSPVRFLFLGGFHTWDSKKAEFNLKGGHTLLEAWKKVEKQLPSASLVIGGPGFYEEKLRQWQKSLNNPQQFFCINSVDPSDIANFIRASDVVIIPSLNEGLPNLAKEAQACGRPVLGTNVGGIPEAVEDGKTGLIIPPSDANAIADGIKWFCDNQDQMIHMGENGRKRMKELFSWEQYKSNMIRFFQSAI
jgi:L-malate glycosyltransferase